MPAPKTADGRKKAFGALGRYRVMAYITGVMLIILCIEMLLAYVILSKDHEVMKYIAWIPMAHGFIYVVYLVCVGDLWSRMRWDVKELIIMVLGGVVPVMSFIVEKKVHAQAISELNTATSTPDTAGILDS